MSNDRDTSSSSSSGSSSSSSSHHDHPPHPPPPTPASPSPSSSPSAHPLLPPLPGQHPRQTPLYSAEVDPYALYQIQRHQTSHQKPIVPERCFTFCTQRVDAAPLCRMFCLRKRQLVPSQSEEIQKLKAPSFRQNHNHSLALAEEAQGGVVERQASSSLSSSPLSSSSASSSSPSWSPFEHMRRTLDPYSFIYVKGTMDGVVGRYMEEMESDDGNYDFGAVSRNADEATRRRNGNGWEFMDWEEHGSLLYLPLSSLFYPILTFPQNLAKALAPSTTFLTKYIDSFKDGTQSRNLLALKSAVEENKGGQYISDLLAHHKRRMEKINAEWAELQEKRKKNMQERKDKMDATNATNATNAVDTGLGAYDERKRKVEKMNGFDEKEVD